MIKIVAVTEDNQKLNNIAIADVDFSQYKWWWIDFSEPDSEEINQLDTALHFHPLAIEDCIHSLQRPKLDYYDDFSFFVTHAIRAESLEQREIDFFIGGNYVVTFHHWDSTEVQQVWDRLMQQDDLTGWDEYRVFYEVLDKVVDNFFPIVYHLEDLINQVEENPEDKPMDVLLEQLFDLRHELLRLRHTINPIRDLFYRMLSSHRLDGIRERREYFADIYDHLMKLSEMVASNREITNDIRDNFISVNSYQQNKVIQVLTVITSIFAPLTFIAGIYGMNFVNMPELEWKYGYYASLVVMFIITVGMITWFKKKGWFG
ncbi:magnesium/cobalt transporter CorA [Sediminibacillus halophilus]|uniref:Magnesium transport protein CorA n=1 Tax=Sediminibacillus halophilus TaxID=482461 RepID=A0A1G9U6U8_9BACI|nr:magnesium/cobalt transporter CorA [Sediminibacillus halophilus]SDM55404.1 magnesium transporter [Sediminibacillus halophilus]